jgi:hypothetical protein
VARQGEAAFALNRERVTVLGRDRHPAFGIEIDCGRALKHGFTFDLSKLAEYEKAAWRFHLPRPLSQGRFPTKRHFFTQMPTLVEAITVVKRFQPIETAFLLMKLRT